jgi:hypothetical protein
MKIAMKCPMLRQSKTSGKMKEWLFEIGYGLLGEMNIEHRSGRG